MLGREIKRNDCHWYLNSLSRRTVIKNNCSLVPILIYKSRLYLLCWEYEDFKPFAILEFWVHVVKDLYHTTLSYNQCKDLWTLDLHDSHENGPLRSPTAGSVIDGQLQLSVLNPALFSCWCHASHGLLPASNWAHDTKTSLFLGQ